MATKAEKSELEIVKATANNLIANAGNTDGNAELIDIRVGADGKTYATSGEAIRTTTKKLMDVVLRETNNLLDPATLVLGDIGSWAGSTINTNSTATDRIRNKDTVEIMEGKSYVFVRNGIAITPQVVSLFDSNGNFIQTISADADKKYTIPTGINAKYSV